LQLSETHKHAHKYIYATRNSATTQEPDAKSQRRRLSRIASSPTCSGTIMPKPRLLLYALAHPITCPTIAYLLACTFLLLFAGHQNELKCMHRTLLDCTTRSKKKTPNCVFMCYNARKKGGKAGGVSPKSQQTPSMSPIRGESEESESGREGSGGKRRKRDIGHLPQHYQVVFHGLKIPSRSDT
jgi:hypothetical protein